MEFWEFLIQKDGDRSWLPLESSTVEILEGRYRVVARSSRCNAAVEIRISHTTSDEAPSKRRLQKRISQTNADGLIVIIPYTRLQPGHWKLRCTGDLITDLMGSSWCHTVTLHVITQDIESQHEWDDWDGDGADSSVESDAPAMSEGMSEAVMGAATEPPNQTASINPIRLTEPALDVRASPTNSPANGAQRWMGESVPGGCDRVEATPQLVLDRTNYVAQRGEELTLFGHVEGVDSSPSSMLELGVYLRDPQTASVHFYQPYPLAIDRVPTTFMVMFNLPTNPATRLFLGEVQLVSRAGIEPIVLAAQSFAVTVDLNQLLEAIANDFAPSAAIRPPLQFLKRSDEIPLNLALLELVQTPAVPTQLHPAGKQLLPPQLHSPPPATSMNVPAKPLELPFATLVKLTLATAIEDTPVEHDAPTELKLETSPSSELDPGGADAAIAPDKIAPEPSPVPLSEDTDTPLAPEFFAPIRPAIVPVKLPPAPEDEAFRSLNLTHRFWSRLNALAGDVELSNWLQRADPIESLPMKEAPLGVDSLLAAHEVLVDDDLLENSNSSIPAVDRPSASTDLSVLAEDEPVPAPQLEMPSAELVAGKSVSLVVTLPALASRIYVKVWVHDRQTRSLLDGPRWLVNFLSTGTGEQQARTQLPVPYGCVEVQFEAIAVEMATQRESHKVTINRTVIPPNLPTSSLRLEDLEI